jgi:undecaprenyl-diphosphatase
MPDRGRQHVMHHVALLLFAGVALLGAAVTTSATVAGADAALGDLARAATSWSRDVDFTISALGGSAFVMPLTAAAVLVLCALREWRGALTLVMAVMATQVVVHLIKVWVERPRPAGNEELAQAAGFSFPSSHSATSMAVYATLALVAARGCRGKCLRVGVLGCAAALVVAVGVTRVILAAHYPIDVLAGWLTGGALVAASWLVAQKVLALRRPA